MNKQEQNLKFLRKLIDNLDREISREKEKFLNDTRDIDFEKFYNKKIVEINAALLEFKSVLHTLIDGLSSEIKRLKFEGR